MTSLTLVLPYDGENVSWSSLTEARRSTETPLNPSYLILRAVAAATARPAIVMSSLKNSVPHAIPLSLVVSTPHALNSCGGLLVFRTRDKTKLLVALIEDRIHPEKFGQWTAEF